MAMDSDEEFLESLREDFVTESTDLLDLAESELLAMEKDKDHKHLIEVNRCLHSLKGSARAVGYAEYSNLLHKFESLVSTSEMKTKDLTRFISASLKVVDSFKELTNAQAAKDEKTTKSQLTNIKLLLTGY